MFLKKYICNYSQVFIRQNSAFDAWKLKKEPLFSTEESLIFSGVSKTKYIDRENNY